MPLCFNQNNFFDRDCLNINFIMARKNLPFKNQWYSHISIRYKNLWQDKCGQMRTFGCPKSCPKRRFAPKSAPRLQPFIRVVKLERAIVTFWKHCLYKQYFLFSNLINRGFNYQSGAPRGNQSPLRHRNWFHLVIMLSMCQRWTIFSQNLLLQNGFKMSQTDLLIVVFTLGILAFGYSIWFISNRILCSIFHRLTKNIWIGMV